MRLQERIQEYIESFDGENISSSVGAQSTQRKRDLIKECYHEDLLKYCYWHWLITSANLIENERVIEEVDWRQQDEW